MRSGVHKSRDVAQECRSWTPFFEWRRLETPVLWRKCWEVLRAKVLVPAWREWAPKRCFGGVPKGATTKISISTTKELTDCRKLCLVHSYCEEFDFFTTIFGKVEYGRIRNLFSLDKNKNVESWLRCICAQCRVLCEEYKIMLQPISARFGKKVNR